MNSESIRETLTRIERVPSPSQRRSALGLALKTWLVRLVADENPVDDETLLLALRLIGDEAEQLLADSSTVESSKLLRTEYDELIRIGTCLTFHRIGCRWHLDGSTEEVFVRTLLPGEDPSAWLAAQTYRRLLTGASQWMLRLATSRSFAEQIKTLPVEDQLSYRSRCEELASKLATSYGDLLFEKEQIEDPNSELHRHVDDLAYFRILGQLEGGSAEPSTDTSHAAEIPASAVMVYHLVVAGSEYIRRRGVVIYGKNRLLFCCVPPSTTADISVQKASAIAATDESGESRLPSNLIELLGDDDVREAFLVDFVRGSTPLEYDIDPDGRWHWSRCPTCVDSPRFRGAGAVSFWGGLEYSSQPRLRVDETERKIFSTKNKLSMSLAEYPHLPANATAPPGRPTPLVFSHYDRWALTDLCRERGIEIEIHAEYTGRREFVSRNLSHVEVLHLATHGEVFPQQPLWANLCFGADEGHPSRVHFADLLGMDWSATSLVFLNCCLSEVGRVAHGDERLSLAWAFLAGGARAVVAHRWPIRDTAASVFANHFYQHWLNPQSAVTLRQAFKRSVQFLRTQPLYADKPTWASFVLLENAWVR